MEQNKRLIWVGIIACILFYILEIVTDIWFGAQVPGYDWKKESLSYIGAAGSPIAHWVELWGFAFSALLLLFALAFYLTFKGYKWVGVATFFLFIYALGEGIGSWSFPINAPNTPLTMDARLHNIFGGIGDTGLVLFPFVMMLLFPKADNQIFHLYLWSVVVIGVTMATFFLTAKFAQPNNFMLHYKGLWQRLYLLNYHSLFLIMAIKMSKLLLKK